MDEQSLPDDRRSVPGKLFSSNKRIFISVIIAVIVAIAAGGAYFLQNTKDLPPSQPFTTYAYTNFDLYSVKGVAIGSGMSFQKPAALKVQTSTTNQVELAHVWKSNNATGETYIAALSQKTPLPTDKRTLDSMRQVLSDSHNKAYDHYAGLIKTFVKDRMPVGWQTSFDPATVFKTTNVNNAWEFALTSSGKEGKLQGKALLMVGQKNFYYLLITSTPNNWRADSNAWQQIFNSLKVDQ